MGDIVILVLLWVSCWFLSLVAVFGCFVCCDVVLLHWRCNCSGPRACLIALGLVVGGLGYGLVIVLVWLRLCLGVIDGLARCGSFRVWFSVLGFWSCRLIAGFGFV